MSPFVFPASSSESKDSGKIFVGKKETRLLVLELETGKMRGLVDPEVCAWDKFYSSTIEEEPDRDDDEPPPRKGAEIYISRTDYRLQIHTRAPSNSSLGRKKRQRTQTLVYSEYGPNKIHTALQKQYQKTR
jgi:serine/threonine-protein kinase/endoribonuclease IRE1